MKQVVEVDQDILRPWRDVAAILGISTDEYLEQYLQDIGENLFVPEEIADRIYLTRAKAEEIAERLEKFAVDAQLSDDSKTGAVATSVVETQDGRWMIKVDQLGPWENAKWRRTSLHEDTLEDNHGDEWKDR